MVDLKDIYWAAGFLDGEGCFSWDKEGNCSDISAPQNCCQLLYRLKNMFGGEVYPRNDGTWSWKLVSNPSIGLMMTLYPLMSDKRQAKIKSIVQTWRITHNTATFSKYRTHCFYGHPWIEENIYVCDNGTHRQCWTCKKEKAREYKALKKQEKNAMVNVLNFNVSEVN